MALTTPRRSGVYECRLLWLENETRYRDDDTLQVKPMVKRLYDDDDGSHKRSSNSHALGEKGTVADDPELRQHEVEDGSSSTIIHVLGTTLEPLVAIVDESARILMAGGKAPEPEEEDDEARKVRESACTMVVAAGAAKEDREEGAAHGANDMGDSQESGKSLGVIMSGRNHGGWNPIEPTAPGTPGTPLLKRLEHLEFNLRSFEDKCSPRSVVEGNSYWSSRSSCLSTPSSIEKRRKPIDDVLEEAEEKGTLVERVASLEQRLDTLSMQLSKSDWAPAVPVLKSPPGRAPKNVAPFIPSDVPAVEEKHEVNSGPAITNGDGKQAEVGVAQQERHKLKKRHTIPHLLKNFLGSAH